MVDALNPEKWKRELVKISSALNVGYRFPSAVSVTNHIVSNTLIALLQTLH